jgi:predicted aminopeptidase
LYNEARNSKRSGNIQMLIRENRNELFKKFESLRKDEEILKEEIKEIGKKLIHYEQLIETKWMRN